jgi:hypothetical protein
MKSILLVVALFVTASFALTTSAEAGDRRGRRCAPYYGGGYGYGRNVVVVNRGYYRPVCQPYYYAPRPVVYAPAYYAPAAVYYSRPRVTFYAGF